MRFHLAIAEASHNVVSMIQGRGNSTSLYYGLAKRREIRHGVDTNEYAEMLRRTMHGNFLGARFSEPSAGELETEVCNPLREYQHITAFPGIPSTRDREGPYVQGIDRFIEAMRGEKYALLCIAEPIKLAIIDGMTGNLFSISSEVHSQVKATVQSMKGTSDTMNMGMFGTKGVMESTTESESYTAGEGSGQSFAGLGGVFTAVGAGLGSIVPGLGTVAGAAIGAGLGTVGSYVLGLPLGTSASTMSSFTRTIAKTVGSSLGGGAFGGYARGWNRSKSASQEVLNKTAEHCEKLCDAYISRLQRGKNLGLWNVGVYLLTSDKYTQIRGSGLLRAYLSGDETHWEPIRAVPLHDETAGAYLVNFNNPKYNILNHGAEKREIEESVGWGAKIADVARKFAEGSLAKLSGILENASDENSAEILEEIRRSPGEYSREALKVAWEEVEKRQLGHPLGPAMGGVSTPMNTEELSIIMNVPRREVQGVTIREAAGFGINYQPKTDGEQVRLGNFVHKRQVINDLPFVLPVSLFQKHAFICGVTGSGKTNTCFSLLRKLSLPFMVIEPAKGEYRRLLRDIPDLQVYTLGDETISPFRLNPFEFSYSPEARDGRLLFHVDAIKSAFNAAFPMYGPMSYILEEAIISVYRDNGWDLAVSDNVYLEKMTSEDRRDRFHDFLPTLRDLFNKVEKIVAQKRYAAEQTMNIEAALKARLSSLLTGSKGVMLDCRRSTPMSELLAGKVVLELKHMGDDEEKCFVMGLVLGRMYAYRDSEGHSGSELRHILLIEEAHRLLKKVPDFVSPEVGNSRGKAVETFCNVISEIRDYGEGIVIVDQIPGKLAPDVVKNTSTKIIHRTLAADDRELLAGSMGLTAEQSRELPLLPVGLTVVHSEGADKPFLIKIDRNKEQDGNNVGNDELRQVMAAIQNSRPELFRRYPGFEADPAIAGLYRRLDFLPFRPQLYAQAILASALLFENGTLDNEFREQASARVRALVRCREPLEVACHIIWNANLFFEKLNEAFPRSMDYCQKAHGALVTSWLAPDREECAGEFREAMLNIVRDRPVVEYLAEALLKYVKSFSKRVCLELSELSASEPGNGEADAKATAVLRTIFPGIRPGREFVRALLRKAGE